MKFPQLLGLGSGSYTMFSPKAEIQRSINCYLQRVESGAGSDAFVLLKSPGLACALRPSSGDAIVHAMFEVNGHVAALVGNTLYTFFTDLSEITTPVSPIDVSLSQTIPVTFAQNYDQLLIASSLKLYQVTGGVSYPFGASVLTELSLPFYPLSVAFISDYFVALASGWQSQFYFSTDGTSWSADNVQTAEASSEQLLAMIVHNNVLFIYGTEITQPFTVGLNPNAPFVPQTNAIIRSGILAPRSLLLLGPHRYWLSRTKDGHGIVHRSQGYDYERISNHAMENIIRQWTTPEQTIGMAYQLNGQDFYRLTNPIADQTIEFNATVGEWLEPLAWDLPTDTYHRHKANCIVSSGDNLLVGDYQNGWIYTMSPDYYTDAGLPIKVLRRAPHIVEENRRVTYHRLHLGMETGVGLGTSTLWLNDYSLAPSPFATALAMQVSLGNVTADQALVLQNIYDNQPYVPLSPYPADATMTGLGFYKWGLNPQIEMSYSDDGGKNFGTALSRSIGAEGTDVEVQWHRLGTARDRVYQFETSEPCKIAITSCDFEAEALAH